MFTDPLSPHRPAHGRGSGRPARGRSGAVAAEPAGRYDAARDASDDVDGWVPFGLPVLDELPELASALSSLGQADRQLIDAVLTLRPLLADGRVEATSGVGIEHWLAATARMAGLDRRLLRRMCRLLDRLPSLADAAAAGKVSFTQLRALTLELHSAPREADVPLDAWLAAAIAQLPADADPDALVKQATRAVDELAPELLDQQADDISHHARRLVIQPFLDGTGGTFHGTEDAIGLAMLDTATAPRRDQLDDVGRARADNLQARLRHRCDDAASAAGRDSGGRTQEDELPIDTLPRPTLLLRWDFDALTDVTATPADLLTGLVGGRLRMTAEHARRLLDARGAQVRAIIVDQGEVVGVGRATSISPEWLRDTLFAIHDTCTEPLCDRPALTADADHAIGWTPTRDHPGGRTSVDNVGPLCGRTNRRHRASGWIPSQTVQGVRTWRHARTGLTITTVPATWRPDGAPPAPRRHRCAGSSSRPDRHRAPPSARGVGPPRYDDAALADRPPPEDDPPPF